MQSSSVEPFPDNWAYLKAELNWLERLLMVAIARQRRDLRDVERVAQSRADRVTSHWWKGLIVLDRDAIYDDGKQPPKKPPLPQGDGAGRVGATHHLEARIQASYQQGIALGLPLLRDRLHLTPFEKNLLLLSLAPEVNRRYAQLYRYLQSPDPLAESQLGDLARGARSSLVCGRGGSHEATELPMVDLALRIFCRNDAEWQAARSCLVGESSLVQQGLLQLVASRDDTLLTSRIKPSAPLVAYLLSRHPDQNGLDTILQTVSLQPVSLQSVSLQSVSPPVPNAHKPPQPPQFWLQQYPTDAMLADLVAPQALKTRLQQLCQRQQYLQQWLQHRQAQDHGKDVQDTPMGDSTMQPGTIVLFAGEQGTGKQLATRRIAQTLQVPLTWVDLDFIYPEDYLALLQAIVMQQPTVLGVRSAQHWLGRSSTLPETDWRRFLQQRRTIPSLTVFTVHRLPTVHLTKRKQMDDVLVFPIPDWRSRRCLWQQAFPSTVSLDPKLDWDTLARRFCLTGGQIQTIAQNATILAIAATSPVPVTIDHILQAMPSANH